MSSVSDGSAQSDHRHRIWFFPDKFWRATKNMPENEASNLMEEVERYAAAGDQQAVHATHDQTRYELVTQAVYGAATMARDSGEHPVILREAVTSPAGTTISAIRELERHGVRAAFLAAIEAARDRGRELGADPGPGRQ